MYCTKEEFEHFINKVKTAKITDHHPVDPAYHSEVPTKSVRNVLVLDVQWSDCPDIVEDEVRDMWYSRELGNDNYIIKTTVDLEMYEEYPNTYMWLKLNSVADGTEIWIHWWW